MPERSATVGAGSCPVSAQFCVEHSLLWHFDRAFKPQRDELETRASQPSRPGIGCAAVLASKML